MPAAGAYSVAVGATGWGGTDEATLVIDTTALVRHAPTVNGLVDGSLQCLLPENVTLTGSASIELVGPVVLTLAHGPSVNGSGLNVAGDRVLPSGRR